MTSLTIKSPSSMGAYFSDEQIKTLRDTVFPKELSSSDFEVFKYVCARTGLDPFMKQIHAVPRKNWDDPKPRMTLITAIDGHRLIAERTGKYAPGKATEYLYDKDGNLISATAYIKKMTPDGTWHEVPGTALYSEYAQRKKNGEPTEMWFKMRHVMLAKCAEVIALRKAFPAEMSGLYCKEEMDQADTVPDNAIEVEVETIIATETENERESFISSWGSDSDAFGTYFEAVCSAYKSKSELEVIHMLKADLDNTNAKFIMWKDKQRKVA